MQHLQPLNVAQTWAFMKYTKVVLALPTCRPNMGIYNTKAAFATPECRSKMGFYYTLAAHATPECRTNMGFLT